MMNFLPQIYEDELLYSVMSRYKQMCGMVSKRAFLKDLFGKEIKWKSISFPQYINEFVDNIPPNSKICSKDIIIKNTMFAFYTSFLSEDKTSKVYDSMALGGNQLIEGIVGMRGSKVKNSKYLKYCPVCFKEDIEENGESYWRRLHQVPGILYCDKHEVSLNDSKVLNTDSRLDYVCLNEDSIDASSMDNYSSDFKKLNLIYIENVKKLFNNKYPRKKLDFIIKFYIDKLREQGLASKGGSIYMKDLLKKFINYYPKDYLKLMQSDIDNENETNWLRLFVRNNTKNRSPLRHLLFLQFLNLDIYDMFKSKSIIGKVKLLNKRSPCFDLKERRSLWLNIIKENPYATRSELKDIGKGLHTWIRAHDKEWYEKVTPRLQNKKRGTSVVDWEKRDEEYLEKSKKAVKKLLALKGKPIRILRETIRRELGARTWFNNKRLVKTHEYINEVEEDIESYRTRKIEWAINDMNDKEYAITAYKVQLYAGFGGGNKEVRVLIERILDTRV